MSFSWEELLMYDGLLFLVLLICFITDLRSRKIYNVVIFPSCLAAFVIHLATGGISALALSLAGFLTGFAVLLIPYLLGGMGAGDVKLLAFVGALKGTVFVLYASLYMALLGGLLALLVLLFRSGFLSRMKAICYSVVCIRYGFKIPLISSSSSLHATYPYGVAIVGGTLVYYWLQGGAGL